MRLVVKLTGTFLLVMLFAGIFPILQTQHLVAQETISTVAGGGVGDDGNAFISNVNSPERVATDSFGNIYFADTSNHRVRKININSRIITTVAGNGAMAYSGDGGQATFAALDSPRGVALDGAGNIYIADTNNNRIRKVDKATGLISTVAGTGVGGNNGDGGAAVNAKINRPRDVFVDGPGNIFIADTNNHSIRKVDISTGIITTVAGNGTKGDSGDKGRAISANLNTPRGVFVDGGGNIFIADSKNNRARKVDAGSGIIDTVAGNGSNGFSGDSGAATSAELNEPSSIAVDGAGDIFIADTKNSRIRMVTVSTGIISTAVGTVTASFKGDGGPADNAALKSPSGVFVDSAGNIIIGDTGNNRIRKVRASTGIIRTVAGSGFPGFFSATCSATNGNGATALNMPHKLFADKDGNIFFADTFNHRIRKIDKDTGDVSTVAGIGTKGYSGDYGPATAANLNAPVDVFVDDIGNIFIADTGNNCIRKIDATTGVINTVAGSGIGYPHYGDGNPAAYANMRAPYGVVVDGADNIFITELADYGAIRKIDKRTGIITSAIRKQKASFLVFVDNAGNIYFSNNNMILKFDAATGGETIVAGNGSAGYSGDGGLAINARLNSPYDLAFDNAGNIFISDTNNNRIRKVDAATGTIDTVAGNGSVGYSGDGSDANLASLNHPRGVCVDDDGNIYIGDSANGAIRKVDKTTGRISTIAGSGASGYSGDKGPAAKAYLNGPSRGYLDGKGDIYFSDTTSNRIRKIKKSTGVITTVVGNGETGPSIDGAVATESPMNNTTIFTLDSSGNIYFPGSGAIKKVDAGTGKISRVTHKSTRTTVRVNPISFMAVDSAGDLYIAGKNAVNKIEIASGTMTTVLGNKYNTFNPRDLYIDKSDNIYYIIKNDVIKYEKATGKSINMGGTNSEGSYPGEGGLAYTASFNLPEGLAVDSAGNVIVADTKNNRVMKVDKTTRIVSTIAGNGVYEYGGDGRLAVSTSISMPTDVMVDGEDNVFIIEKDNNIIRKVDAKTGIISTIAGNGEGGGQFDWSNAVASSLNQPEDVVTDSYGNMYIADTGNNRIRKVDAVTGCISVVAGTGAKGSGGDGGDAASAKLNSPRGVAIDNAGNIFIADTLNKRVRKVDIATGIINTVAGDGTGGYSGDGGPAAMAQLDNPAGVFIDGSNNIFIADTGNNCVRKVDIATGNISTIAGDGSTAFAGDGGLAVNASLHQPTGVFVDVAGNVFIADRNHSRVRKVDVVSGVINTVAGNGAKGFNGDGQLAIASSFNNPTKIWVNDEGDIFIADENNNLIRKVDAATGLVSSVAGNKTAGFSGDNGDAVLASLNSPMSVALDSGGNLYIADKDNYRIRKVGGYPLKPRPKPPVVDPQIVAFSVIEGNSGTSEGFVTVNIDVVSSGPVAIDYATSNGSALEGVDYFAASGTLTINPGDKSGTFTVSIIGDTWDELDETINLTLSNPVNGIMGAPKTATLVIINDDSVPIITF